MLGPVIVDLVGQELSPEEAELIQHPHVGGIIFFGRNFANPAQAGELIRSIRAVRPELILSVDQEGGRVQRFRSGFTRLPALQLLGRYYQSAAAQSDSCEAAAIIRSSAWIMAAELLSLGIDISFAPVLDADDYHSEVIGDRSFASEVSVIDTVGSLYLNGMAEAGMVATAKHFPGHGAVQADSHVALPVDERDFETVWNHDMQPFRTLLPRVGAVMPAHILFENIDPRPVGCSPFWLQQVLRQQLGFDGVIFSDDLSMAGAEFSGSYSERALAALEAGCDAILVCNQPERAAEVLSSLAKLQWPCNDKLAKMRPRLRAKTPTLEQLKAAARWQQAQRHLEILETVG